MEKLWRYSRLMGFTREHNWLLWKQPRLYHSECRAWPLERSRYVDHRKFRLKLRTVENSNGIVGNYGCTPSHECWLEIDSAWVQSNFTKYKNHCRGPRSSGYAFQNLNYSGTSLSSMSMIKFEKICCCRCSQFKMTHQSNFILRLTQQKIWSSTWAMKYEEVQL